MMAKNSAELLIVGAGFSGAVVARELVEKLPIRIRVVDERDHIGGNCHSARDSHTGVMVHIYGPHIFNTDNERVWNYINEFGRIHPFVNRVKASTRKGVFSLPINLHTINQFFGKSMNPSEARLFLATQGDSSILDPRNFEEQAIKMIGHDLYKTFFYGYTKKQWGCEPTQLPASILKRLPVRFSYDDNYYNKRYQGIPVDGYTDIIAKILDHPRIEIQLGVRAERSNTLGRFQHVIHTGPLDAWFGRCLGMLGYRTVTFERIEAEGDFQGNAVINYPDMDVPWTRIHEHKHFAPWETHERTVAFREYSKETTLEDIPYYPKRLSEDLSLLKKYRAMAEAETGASFIGRLATYRYMDMETVIGEALEFSEQFSEAWRAKAKPCVFPNLE